MGEANGCASLLCMSGSRIDRTATRMLAQANARAQSIRVEAFSAAGSSGYLSRLLASVADQGEASQVELSRRTGIDPSDVVAALNDLAARGFVTRRRDPADGRRNLVALTSSGRTELRRLDAVVTEIQERFLSPLSGPERRQLEQLLVKLIQH